MLSKIINFLNTFNLNPGFTVPELLPGDFLDTRGRAEKTTFVHFASNQNKRH